MAFRYTLAIAAAIAAVGLRLLFTPILGSGNPYHTVWLAVVFSAWYCGLGPSILTTLLAALGVCYWFLPPLQSFAVKSGPDLYGMLAFLIFSSAIIALGESNRRGSAARNRLAAIVESSEDAIVSKNLNGIIGSWNLGAQRIFGYRPEEAIGRSITLIIPPELQDEEKRILDRLRAGERIDHFETVRLRKDGSRVDVALTISPLRDSQGRVTGASKIARDITERKRIEQVLRESEISARLLAMQDEEKRRIARELHDGAGQLLAGVAMNISLLEKEKDALSPEAAKRLSEIGELIRQVSGEIRTMSYLLHPPLLDEMGLQSALKWYVGGFAERSGIRATLDLPADLGRLPQELELCLFRVVQECLTNVHRHAKSTSAAVKLSSLGGNLILEVRDDGHGVSRETLAQIASGKATGVGLRGMRERAASLGGKLTVESGETGTAVSVTLPLDQKQAAASGHS